MFKSDDNLSEDQQNKENILQNHSTSSFNSDNSLSVSKINEEYHAYQLNEKVTNLATNIYQELEKIIKEFGRDTVKDLMPIVVNILEALDLAYQEREELKVENELFKDDNEQLLNQYEREKQFRKDCEQKQFQLEDVLVEQKKEYDEKIQSLESIVRMIELKSKNSSDHVARLEEKEIEMKREYTKLHERYTELFKTHCDYMERNKILYGVNADDDNDSSDNNHSLRSKKRQQQQQQQKPIDDFIRNKIIKNAISSDAISQLTTNSNRNEITTVITNLLQEIEQQHQIKQDDETKITDLNREFIIDTNRVDDDFNEHITSDFDVNKEIESEDEAYSKNDLSLYNELSRENYDPSEVDDGADLSGMTREVANLIRENTELLQTKHALNVLKDDLIAKLDNFSSEMIILKEEINSLQYVKGCLQLRISELEEESKKTREETSAANNTKNDKSSVEDDDGPTSQRKRFTRVEMARVLMERNQYKERLMDLQEAVRWTEYMRASKADPTLSLQTSNNNNNKQQNLNEEKKKSPIWKFFSGLFGSKNQQEQQQSPTITRRQNDRSIEQVVPYAELNNNVIPEKVAKAYEFLIKENNNSTQAATVVKKSVGEDKQPILKDKCRIQAYGWSLPSKNETNETSDVNNLAIPVPIYCQPIYDRDNDLKPSCATILNLADDKSSSLVWICSLCKNDTYVSILDPNSPKEQKEQFVLKSMKVLCVQSVKGCLETPHETVKTEESSLKATCLNSTVWFGTQEGWLLVHNSGENLTSSLSKLKLKDAVLSILQNSNVVIVGLADGSIILFSCDQEYWDLKNYKTITLDLSHCSVRSIINVSNEDVWCGVGNKIYDINPHKLEIVAEIEAHPRKESQVRNMVCVGEGVWVSIRLDSTIRLFHSKTKQHLQYLDIEPFVTRMLGTSSLGLSLTRITSLISASNYLWIGTGNGAIISIPFTQKNDLPYCNLNKAQFSFHGHRDTVRFFLNVAGKGLHKGVQQQQQQSVNSTSNKTMLVLSGGQGYVDFRVSDSTTSTQIDNKEYNVSSINSKIDRSYLIVWQI